MSRPIVLVPLARLLGRGYREEARLTERLAGEARVDAHQRTGRFALLVEDGDAWVVLVKRLPR